MIPFGSVPVASSHVRTSPTVASLSLILCRMASAEDQNTADSGVTRASSPRRMPGNEPSASAEGKVSSASATSRLVSSLSGRAASSATRSASRFTPRSLEEFAPAQVGAQHGGDGNLGLLGLEVLDQGGQDPRGGDRGVVQCG